jgi:electron transfer flavoprotein alpha subunit
MEGGILVLAEHLRAEIADTTYEMLGIGRKLADALKVPLHAALLGKGVSSLASHLAVADSVFVLDQPQLEMPSPDAVANLLNTIVGQKNISIVLVGGTNVSIGIGPKLSFRSHLPFVNFCRNIQIVDGKVAFTSQLFGGKILSDGCFPENRGIVGVYPGSFPVDQGKSDKTPSIETLSLPVEETKVNFRRFIEPETGDVDITKQDILVSVGRGIENADNIAMAEELAQLLGGAVCASRPVVDQGWLPMSRQVGKSGMNVKPKLYLSLGISGSPEHVEGMQRAGLIISVNKDPNAPIFDVSHYGVCADLFDILPALTNHIKTLTEERQLT